MIDRPIVYVKGCNINCRTMLYPRNRVTRRACIADSDLLEAARASTIWNRNTVYIVTHGFQLYVLHETLCLTLRAWSLVVDSWFIIEIHMIVKVVLFLERWNYNKNFFPNANVQTDNDQ